jgi:hypothetical protein
VINPKPDSVRKFMESRRAKPCNVLGIRTRVWEAKHSVEVVHQPERKRCCNDNPALWLQMISGAGEQAKGIPHMLDDLAGDDCVKLLIERE